MPKLLLKLKKFIFLILFFYVIEARADWTLIYSDPEFSSFLDFTSLENAGEYFRIQHLLNFNTVQSIESTSSLSVEIFYEIDCTGNRSRNLSSVWYVDAMGEGHVNYSDSISTEWMTNIPRTLSQHLWFVMCSPNFI